MRVCAQFPTAVQPPKKRVRPVSLAACLVLGVASLSGTQILFVEATALIGNWSGGAYWPPTFARLPEDDEDPLAVQAYWARNAASGLDYVLEHRRAARPAPVHIQRLRAMARRQIRCSCMWCLLPSSMQRAWPSWLAACNVCIRALVLGFGRISYVV